MKKISILSLIIFCLMAVYSYAQTGHGMMRGHGSGEGMMEHMMMHEEMMGHEQMTGDMTDIMTQMSELMGEMSEMMKDMPKDKAHQMSFMMRDMCPEMNRISEMLDTGTATDEEIKVMHDKIMEMKKGMTEIKQ